jgi:hypothetical protein
MRLPGLDSDPANAFHPKVITSRLPGTNLLDEWIGDYAQTEVATHYFWIADYTSM